MTAPQAVSTIATSSSISPPSLLPFWLPLPQSDRCHQLENFNTPSLSNLLITWTMNQRNPLDDLDVYTGTRLTSTLNTMKTIDSVVNICSCFNFDWCIHFKSLCIWILLYSLLKYQSNRSFIIPPGIPRAFDAFSYPEGRAFDHHSLGVGNLIVSLDLVLRVALIPRD